MTNLTIHGQEYVFVKTRQYDPISIYQGPGTFLRIGPGDKLEKEANFHRQLFNLGFPVPEILTSGQHEGQFYYIETAFSGEHFGKLFAKDYEEKGEIAEETFVDFLRLVELYASAQLKTVKQTDWSEDLYALAQFSEVSKERPDLADRLERAFQKVKTKLVSMPAVLTHQDFNPWNLFPDGIIDIGDFSYGPAGYDLVMNIFHTFSFPSHGDSERYRKSQLSAAQQQQYLDHIDALFKRQNLPAPSNYVNDYIVCKMTWSSARMDYLPKLQALRFSLLERLLDAYLSDQELRPILLAT